MIPRLAKLRWLILLMAVASAAYLLPLTLHPTWFPFAPGADTSDALIAHLSSAAFLRRSIETWGEIPLWNPTIVGGLPFAADPLSGLWYPPLWLLAMAPQAPTLNLLAWLHLVVAGTGMYRLLRGESLGRGAALVGGLVFAGMPKLIGHIGLGHVTLVAAVAWTPWTLFAAGQAMARAGEDRWRRRFVGLGVALGIVFLADPRWFLPAVAITAAYAAWRWSGRAKRAGDAARLGSGSVVAALAVIALTAALALPLWEFTLLSTRAGLVPGAADAMALPAARLLGLLVAEPAGWAEWLASMGSAAFVLAVAGAAGWSRSSRFWLFAGIVALLLSLGSATPLGSAVTVLPGFDLLRVPARWLFLVGLSVASLAAHGVEALDARVESVRKRARLGALAAAGTILGVGLGIVFLGGFLLVSAISGLVALVATASARIVDRAGRLVWGGGLLAILIVGELAWIDSSLIEPRSPESAMGPGENLAARIGPLPDGARLYSPSYSMPQEVAAFHGLELADGVHPLQLAGYVGFMGAATGMDVAAYSVTLPPFEDGDPALDWGPSLDAYRLGLLAVTKVVAAYPIEAEGIELESAGDGVWIYTNRAARPRAWVEPSLADEIAEVDHLEWTPNWVRIRAQGPGRVVLSDIDYPGWDAAVDGRPVEIEAYQGLLRSVDIPGGNHEILLTFVPTTLLAGLGISLGAALLTVIVWRRP